MISRLRWTGFAGAVLLAVGAYLAGALPGAAPATRTEALWGAGPGFPLGLAAYLVGLVLLAGAWWRLGHAFRGPDRPRLRWVLATGAWWAAPLLVAPPLGSRDSYAYACQGAVWLDGHDPYTVGAAAGGCPWLTSVPSLWQDATAPYGPLALVAAAVVVALARALTASDSASLWLALGGMRLVAVAGTLLVAACGPRLARACGVDAAAAAWLGLVTPLVAVHAVSGGHNDALVAGLVVAALASAAASAGNAADPRRHRRMLAAGLLIGLAAAVKVTAVVALPFLLVLAAGPRPRRYRPALSLAAAAVAGFVGLAWVTGLGLGWVAALPDTGELVQWSAPVTGLGMAAGYLLWGLGWPGAFDAAVAIARVLGLIALAGVSLALLVRAWRRADDTRAVVAAAGAALAAVVLLGPVLYPWYALVPLAVLAAAVAQPWLRRWCAVATLVLVALVLPSGLGVPVLTKLPGALAMLAVAAVLTGWWWRGRRLRVAPGGRPAAPPPDAPVRPPGPHGPAR